MRGRLAEEITNKVKGDNKVQFNATGRKGKTPVLHKKPQRYLQSKKM